MNGKGVYQSLILDTQQQFHLSQLKATTIVLYIKGQLLLKTPGIGTEA